MVFISDIMKEAPAIYRSPLQKMTYESLAKLQIPFERVETDETITMEECTQINQKLDMKMVKTLFLCNRQKTAFYLFVTTADKPFNSKSFSNELGIPRVSFAPTTLMEEILGLRIGAASVFGTLMDKDSLVQVVFDNDVLSEEWYGCSDGVNTGYMKVKTEHIIDKFLTYTNHMPTVIQIQTM